MTSSEKLIHGLKTKLLVMLGKIRASTQCVIPTKSDPHFAEIGNLQVSRLEDSSLQKYILRKKVGREWIS